MKFDRSKFDDRFPQMDRWSKAGARGGIPFIDSVPIKATLSGGDSADINAAITKVANNGGGGVLLKNGFYRINREVRLKSNVSLIGQSRDGVVAEISMKKGNGFLIGNNVRRAGISRMTIQGAWGKPRHDWNIGSSSANNELPGNENVSIMIKGATDSWVDGVDILNSGDFPMRVNANHITMRDLNVDGVHNKHGGAHGYFFILDGHNLLTQSRITHLRHISLQGDGVEYNVVYDNDFAQEISFHSGDDGNNLIENNRVTLPRDMPNSQPDYRAVMGPWSSKHRKSETDNFLYGNTLIENNHGGNSYSSGRSTVFAGPIFDLSRGEKQTRNFPAMNIRPQGGTLYPIVLD